MDPAAGVSTPTNPAEYAVLLLEHRRQLQRLNAATEAIMTHLQLNPPVSSVSSAASSASQPSPAAAAADCASDPTPAHTPGPRMALPDKFSGDPEQCVGFLMQCELFLRQQPSLYPTEDGKMSLVCSLLTGAAREWIAALWTGGSLPFYSYTDFTQQLREVFNHPADGKDAGAQLYGIKQGRRTAAAYSLRFRTLAARTDWTSSALTTAFREGLATELQRELACRDEGLSLDNLIVQSIMVPADILKHITRLLEQVK